jgi:pimeloyl-ACP methyl ester carboxylesterase
MSFARVPHGSLFYERLGNSGDPTTLVHGSWGDHHVWDLVEPGLARSLEVLVYDRRGHGLSSGEARSHPVRDDVGDLAALLEAADFHPVHLVAVSYGATVALRLAVERPELVRSLALHEPPCVGLLDDDPESQAEAQRVADSVRSFETLRSAEDRSRAGARIVEMLSGRSSEWERIPPASRTRLLEGSDEWLVELEDPDANRVDLEAMRSVAIPVLLTVGDTSPQFLHRIGERFARALPNATLVTLPGAGPFPQLTHPDLLVGVVGSFLLERNVPTT